MSAEDTGNGHDAALVAPVWAGDFRVGELFTVKGWVVRVAGHYRGDDGNPEGFALSIEGPTLARLKGGETVAKTKKGKGKDKKGDKC